MATLSHGPGASPRVPWVAALNAWSLLLSALVFVLSAWLAGYWVDCRVGARGRGPRRGRGPGMAGLALTRFEHTAQGLYYTPNRWLVLTLTLIVAARIAYGLVRMGQAWAADAHVDWLAQQGSLLAVAGLLLGHYLAYAWGLRRRLRQG